MDYLLLFKSACVSELVRMTKQEWDELPVIDAMFLLMHELKVREKLKQEMDVKTKIHSHPYRGY